ncbi:murein biosynthesis integral membrane protein MurJ [Candidatus Peregrinibacteria bacterium CG11_big_fil_rev_8_21_14_0_20_46_8]|nr:MAG: murein biosynthesis integral membrane protein MurJ [Candidatus Peregrinibacteria bacterium CG11_big_fil_rev_8_21_14_0_20_46_8]
MNLLEKLWARKTKFFAGASILTITTFGSYVLGLVRDRTFAQTFGATRELDIYNAAFNIPDLILNVLVAGALSAAFIPVFTGLRAQKQEHEANEVASTLLNSAVVVVAVVGAIAFIFMPWIAPKIAPGFSAEELEILISHSRIFLLSPIIFAVSNGLGSMLISYQHYLPYGLSPILYNFGIIGGTFFVPRFGVTALIIGTLGGALLHLGVRLLGISRTHFHYHPLLKWRDKNFLQIVKLMIPKMVGHPVEQITFIIFTNVASTLAAGSIAVVSFARNFQSVPVSLFGIAFSLAIFPMLSEAAAQKDLPVWLGHFKKALRDILYFTVPSAVVLFALSEIPIRIFLGGGNFTEAHIARTALTLSFFAFAVPTESVVHLLARSFYSLKNTLTPVIVSVIGLGVTAAIAFSFAPRLDIVVIPLAFAAGSATRVVLLSALLYKKLGSFSHNLS